MDFDVDFDELAALAYRTAFRILGSRAEAEEIAQESMTRALVRWGRVRHYARPFVCRVAANLAISGLRRRARQPEVASGDLVDGDRTVDRIDLQRALLTLPRRQREVLVLRYVVDLPESDVADALGLTVGTVKTHTHRALAAMRAVVSPDPDLEPKAAL